MGLFSRTPRAALDLPPVPAAWAPFQARLRDAMTVCETHQAEAWLFLTPPARDAPHVGVMHMRATRKSFSGWGVSVNGITVPPEVAVHFPPSVDRWETPHDLSTTEASAAATWFLACHVPGPADVVPSLSDDAPMDLPPATAQALLRSLAG